MYYLILFCIVFFMSIPLMSQTIEYVRMSINFTPPLDRTILDKLENDTTDTWIKFIRVNYIFYLDGYEVDPRDLKQKMYLDNRIKNLVTIERRK